MSISPIFTEDKQKVLDLHNDARLSSPGPPRPPLVWSETLTAAASEWGRQMIRKLSRPDSTLHDARLRQKPYAMGENLFAGSGGKITLCKAVRGWIRERADYEGEPVTADGLGGKGGRKKVGHYTQIIWPETTKVGMSMIKNGEWVYIVARYDGPQMIGGLPWGEANTRAIIPNPQVSASCGETSNVVARRPSSPPKTPRSLPDHEIQRILDLHNEARHEAPGGPRPDLVWSETLASAAKKWASELARQNKGFYHDDQLVMGENLAWSHNYVQSYGSAVRDWINEKWDYHGEAVGKEDRRKGQVGHYTQIICHAVTKVGMARVTKGSNTYIVARYDDMQIRGTKPWGSATELPAGAVDNRRTSSPDSSGMDSCHGKRSSSQHSPRRHERSLVDEIIDGMPRLVIKDSKISFHPFGKRSKGRRRSKSR